MMRKQISPIPARSWQQVAMSIAALISSDTQDKKDAPHWLTLFAVSYSYLGYI